MGLFDLLKPKKNELTFIQSSNYRGFKKFSLVNYEHKPSEDGLKKLHEITHDFNLQYRTIRLVDFVYEDKHHGVAVYVDKYQVGTYFGAETNELSNAMRAGKISAAYVRVDTFKKMGKDTFGALLFVMMED